jgi:hypothetical protein
MDTHSPRKMTNLWRHWPVFTRANNAASVVNNGLAEMQEYAMKAIKGGWSHRSVAHAGKKEATRAWRVAVSIGSSLPGRLRGE